MADGAPVRFAPALVAEGAAMRRLLARAARLARTRATLLVTGETGTGKGVLARWIHERSPARDAPFVQVDCASLVGTLVESELFGHERGAFTGAEARRAGRLELAGEGTLFLDEVGELPPRLQAKLLRALQERVFERVGGSETLPLRARVVAATNVDLERAVREGRFRADLFYRLHVSRLHLPALRERPEDLPALARALAARSAERLGRPPPRLAAALLARLGAHDWPGNVRELENALEAALLEGEGEVLGAADLARALPAAASARPPPLAATALHLADAPSEPAPRAPSDPGDAARILAALRATGGNVARAARRLGLPRSTLRHRIARHRLESYIPRD